MGDRLYKREVAVTIARPVAGQFFAQQPNAIIVRGLRVQFEVEKTLEAEPNTCRVTITNLAEATRAELQRKPLHIRLDAGYDGELARLFTGDLRHVEHRYTGVEWESIMEVGDGERAYRHARVSRSFRSGIDTKTVLEETAKSMGLKLPTSAKEAKELTAQFAAGFTLQGPSQREMDRLLAPHGMESSIQDGALQILRKGDVRPGTAIVVSQSTGLIGPVEFGAPSEPGKPPVLSFQMLLNPDLTPGGLIRMQSRAVTGDFKLTRGTHSGDTHGQAWFSAGEAVPR